MLRRALEPEFGERAAQALAAANIVGTKRAEELAVADFARLANALASSHA
jgi:16S rRNA A1518/A1519 N6-dimethyltransferase RsmA/KsgA/DIM1 with predicted DNA glycosylase/AP lyase activity